MMFFSSSVRRPAVSGAFYPDSSTSLRQMVRRFIDDAPKAGIDGRIIGLISPHAGYVYSGHVAGHAYKQIEGKSYDSVVIIGPSHRVPFRGFATWAKGSFETPLGNVPIDEELASELINLNNEIKHLPQAHAYEHSIEVQLPFLQESLKEFKLVPILMQDYSETACRSLANTLGECLKGRKVLIVASTDLSHYPEYDEAVKADRVVIEAILEFDSTTLRRRINEYMRLGIPELHTMMCGAGPVYVLLDASKLLGAQSIKVLKYANSGDLPFGDKSQVVGYMAAAIW